MTGVKRLDMVDLAHRVSESYPAIPGSLPIARATVIAIAGEAGASAEQMDHIRLAVSEALTNAILHAYADGPGDIHLTATVAAGELWVLVADDGAGLRPRGDRSGLGLGLALIAYATDELTILRRSGGGTELRMRFSLELPGEPTHDQLHGSVASATTPASSIFSTAR